MKIECTEIEKGKILKMFENGCPFDDMNMEHCGEDTRCDECMQDNIEWDITD